MGSSGSKASSPNNGSTFANNNLYDFLQGTSKGLHIHSLTPSSPASLSGLESFFDFITHLNGERVQSANDWTVMLEEFYRKMDGAPSPLYLIVYSSKTTTLRNITVIPTLQISGNEGESSVVIGAGVKECDFSNAHERVWHVLEVIPGSPAALSGLVEQTDYIVGSRDVEGGKGLIAKSDFGALVSLFENRQLHLWVYSTLLDTIREVVLVPDSTWGGDGMLGCDIGSGHVHRIALALQEKNVTTHKDPSKTEANHSGTVSFLKHPSFPAGGEMKNHDHNQSHSNDHHDHHGPSSHDHRESSPHDHHESSTRAISESSSHGHHESSVHDHHESSTHDHSHTNGSCSSVSHHFHAVESEPIRIEGEENKGPLPHQ